MRTLTLVAISAALIFSSGCSTLTGIPGSGVAATQTRTTSDFHAIVASGTADVNVSVGGMTSVIVNGDDNLLEMIRTEVVDGKLKIWTEGNYSSNLGLSVDVTVPAIDEITVSGTADVVATGIEGDLFRVSISGTGDAKVTGEVNELDVTVSGTGDAMLKSLRAKSVKVRSSGTGDATVFASESVDARASGTSDIKVHGKPAQIKQKTSGVGDIVIDA
jgi:hypothetical protein